VLTVGDGLVSAIPALLISVAGALITTRTGTDAELSSDVTSQVFSNPRPLGVAAVFLGAMAVVPGMPTLAFLTLAAGCGGLATALRSRERKEAARAAEPEAAPARPAEEPIEPLLAIDPLTIEVGYDLVEMAGSEKPGGLLDRIRGIRRQTALDLGFVVPPVRVRDNLRIGPDEYRLLLRGVEVGRNRLPRGRALAIDPGDALEQIPGEKTKDPAFGIEALWIDESRSDQARSAGYTVVDRTSVVATHLSETIRKHCHELLGRQETQRLVDILGKSAPKLVEELLPERYTIGQVQKVLQALLRERVSIRDLQTVCETLADCAGHDLPTSALVARVRQALGRSLVRPLVERDALHVVTLAPDVEQQLRELAAPGPDGRPLPADPRLTHSLVHRMANALRDAPSGVQPAVLCASAETRSLLRQLSEAVLPNVPVLSVFEVPDGVRVQSVGEIR
jgi:flagellar biosynthesis protein FlhA